VPAVEVARHDEGVNTPLQSSSGRTASAPDAVVIGAGHNGLVAANLLVDAGWDVVVVEAQEWPGGAVRTAEVTAPGLEKNINRPKSK